MSAAHGRRSFQALAEALLKNELRAAHNRLGERLPLSRPISRTLQYAATMRDEGNETDGRFSAACYVLISCSMNTTYDTAKKMRLIATSATMNGYVTKMLCPRSRGF